MKLHITAIAAIAIFLELPVPRVYAAEAPCKAGTSQEVGLCIDKLNAGSISTIEITNKISCTAASPCRFNITSTSGGTIFGSPSDLPAGSKPGFYRSGAFSQGAYSEPVFKITNASNLTIANLVFDDNINDANCSWGSPNMSQCNDQIAITDSKGITLKQLFMTNAKAHSISIRGSNVSNFTLKNSTIAAAYVRGIAMDSNVDALVEGNYVYDNRAAGLVTGSLKNSTIKNNFFSRNQNRVPWLSRVGGGQINFESENSAIIGNKITEVVRPETVENYGGSIELHVRNVNLTIRDNDFVNKLSDGFVVGPAIYNDPGGAIYTNVSIDNNRMDTPMNSDIRSAVYDWMGGNSWVWGTNCFDGNTSCVLPPYGTLSVDPNPCIIEPGKSSCSVTVSWLFAKEVGVAPAPNMEVKVGSTSFANWARGVQRKVDGITETPIPFTLWKDGKLLTTVNVSGVALGTTLPAKPGDLNGDGVVNIDDFNFIKSNFATHPYTIFDFNRLVENFGK